MIATFTGHIHLIDVVDTMLETALTQLSLSTLQRGGDIHSFRNLSTVKLLRSFYLTSAFCLDDSASQVELSITREGLDTSTKQLTSVSQSLPKYSPVTKSQKSHM